MGRPDHRLWALWLAGLLLVPLAMTAAGLRPNEIPGDTTTNPGWQPRKLLDDDYYSSIDDWIVARTPSRGIGLWTRHLVDYRLFEDSTSDRVAIGADGWAFSRAWIDVPCETIDAIAPPTGAAGITWTTPLPKVHWLGHLLEPHDLPDACTVDARDALRDRMAADPTALDINRAIEDDPMGRFYERDPHWSAAGRVAVAELIVEHFAPGLWEANAVGTAEERLLQGMDRFLGVNDISVLPDLVVERDVELEHVVPQAYGLGLLIFQQSRAEGDAVIPGTTYIFGDSQIASVIPYVDQYFEELIFVGWLRAALGPLPPTLPAPDRVFVEALDQWAIDSFESPVLASVIDRLKTE